MTQVARQAPNQYFEGILQLRNPKDEVIDFIFRSMKKYKRGISIAKEVKIKNGIDFYFSSKKFLRTLSNQLYSEFGGMVSLNEKLFSRDRQKSRHIYRLNVLFKVPDFSKGDVIESEGKLILVKKTGKKISGTEINDGKSVSFKYSEEINIIPVFDTTISKVKPNIEVLHPQTYESVEVKNAKLRRFNVGDKVRVVIKDGVYVV